MNPAMGLRKPRGLNVAHCYEFARRVAIRRAERYVSNMRNNLHFPAAHSRRDFLFRAGGGLGGIALSWLLARDGVAADTKSANPLAAKKPHFEPKAKSVIFLFMVGGPSQVDLFDPKPELTKQHGK